MNIAGPDILSLRQVGDIIGKVVGRAAVYEHRSGDAVDYVGDTVAATTKLCAATTSFERGIFLTTCNFR